MQAEAQVAGARLGRGGRWVLPAVLFALLVVYPFVVPPYLLSLLTEVFIYGIFAMSLDLILGYTGLVSFGHAAFFGVGAYAAGIAAVRLSPHMGLTLPLAAPEPARGRSEADPLEDPPECSPEDGGQQFERGVTGLGGVDGVRAGVDDEDPGTL